MADLKKITVRLSKVNWISVSTHGAERQDRAGADRYVRVGPVVIGIPHGWRKNEHLKELAAEKFKLLAELELMRFRTTGKFNP